ncbi:hypothetical protein LX77_01391 [Gelidibacter algens]|uniref:DUF3575 domain-containing protein n=1 Tax=Gelidibacter algens TaxID=49280 RepID=A0A1A7QS49_9FLAO|nr:hypothetical protein [Gelidibacter algens]OBX21357.1 hypothetical protein A9996_18180 [Gelidibacter algens]RAJ25090.1 hypothetical protein LX77_01391 [Gelidibacter algens]
MQNKILWIGLVLVLTSSLKVNAQNAQQDSIYKRFFVGSSLLMLGNFDTKNSPEYVQLNFGYRITPKDVVSLDLKRSVYNFPIGLPFGSSSYDKPGEEYPGHGRIVAPTIGYQRFIWKGAFASVHALNAFEKYLDENDKKIGNGYTLYLNFHLGYQFKFFKNRIFFEPAIGCSYWPIRNNVPQSFKSVEEKWPNYFIQPGLNFGYNF